MRAYLARRLLAMVLVWAGVVTLTFIIATIVPRDPVALRLGNRATPEAIAFWRHELGFDQPILAQFAHWVMSVLHGDLGVSVWTGRPIIDDLLDHLPATIELGVAAAILAAVVGIPLGAIAAASKGSFIDRLSGPLSTFFVAIPPFWLGTVLQVLLYRQLGLLPFGGRIELTLGPPASITGLFLVDSVLAADGTRLLSSLGHLVLPALTLSLLPMSAIFRQMRASTAETLSADYIRTARSKGISGGVVLRRHVLRNSLLPVTTVLGLVTTGLLSGAFVIESVFDWHGIGWYAVKSILNADYFATVSVTLVVAVIVTVANLATDLAYGVIDPRIRILVSASAFGLTGHMGRVRRISLRSWLVLGLILALLLIAVVPSAFTPDDPLGVHMADRLQSPSSTNWFGTDELGRDVLSRTLAGTGLALQSAGTILLIAVTIGMTVGLLAGYYGGWIDEALMRVTDVFFAFPGLVLAMSIAAALGPSLGNAMIAISSVWWPQYARLIRGQVLSIRESDFVTASRTIGSSDARIIREHIIPGVLASVLVFLVSDMGLALGTAAALSFIGLGAQPPTPEWGSMISVGREYMLDSWWMSAFPGLAIVVTVSIFNGLAGVIGPALAIPSGDAA